MSVFHHGVWRAALQCNYRVQGKQTCCSRKECLSLQLCTRLRSTNTARCVSGGRQLGQDGQRMHRISNPRSLVQAPLTNWSLIPVLPNSTPRPYLHLHNQFVFLSHRYISFELAFSGICLATIAFDISKCTAEGKLRLLMS